MLGARRGLLTCLRALAGRCLLFCSQVGRHRLLQGKARVAAENPGERVVSSRRIECVSFHLRRQPHPRDANTGHARASLASSRDAAARLLALVLLLVPVLSRCHTYLHLDCVSVLCFAALLSFCAPVTPQCFHDASLVLLSLRCLVWCYCGPSVSES